MKKPVDDLIKLEIDELINDMILKVSSTSSNRMETSVNPILTEDLIDYGNAEKKNIHKEKTRNHNQPYAFLGGGAFGEQLVLLMFLYTIGSASKGGMAFDNKTLDDNKKIIKAKEIKFVSLNGTKKCNKCNEKCPPFQQICIYCSERENFKEMSDSRAGISSKAHMDYKDIIDEYIIFVQKYCDDTKIISLKAYKFLTKNEYFDNYIENQFNSGHTRGGSCNFIPYSYDWFMSGPIKIMNVDINISDNEPKIKYQHYDPLSNRYDKVSMSDLNKVLKKEEKDKLDHKMLNDAGYYEYEYISSILTIRKKNIGKPRGSTSRK